MPTRANILCTFTSGEPAASGINRARLLSFHHDAGWGWIADKGFDIIQTDWVMPCVKYLEGKGKR